MRTAKENLFKPQSRSDFIKHFGNLQMGQTSSLISLSSLVLFLCASVPLLARVLALLANIRISWKTLLGTNTSLFVPFEFCEYSNIYEWTQYPSLFYITRGWKVLPGTNTQDSWAQS
jgi:hypothetical protein